MLNRHPTHTLQGAHQQRSQRGLGSNAGQADARGSKSVVRGRHSKPLDPNGEHVSDAALGLDDAWRAGVAFELAPQSENLYVDAAIENVLMHARGLQQVLTAERALWRLKKGEQ